MNDCVMVEAEEGGHFINLSAVAGAHWEKKKGTGERTLFVHFIGGRYESFTEQQGAALWLAIVEGAPRVEVGTSGNGR